MGGKTKIRWTDATWNPLRARPGNWICRRVSPGCDNCYASALNTGRWVKGPSFPKAGDIFPKVETYLDEKQLARLRTIARGSKVFVCDMTDLFGEWWPIEWQSKVIETMLNCELTYQILTKRPRIMAKLLPALWPSADDRQRCWVGTSIESDVFSWRANYLRGLKDQGFTTFISAEPLLGPLLKLDLAGIDWLIVGGESGPGYRPMDVEWARQLREKARDAGVAFFFKQSSHRFTERGQDLDGERWEQFPVMHRR